jgi:hypothetical protein
VLVFLIECDWHIEAISGWVPSLASLLCVVPTVDYGSLYALSSVCDEIGNRVRPYFSSSDVIGLGQAIGVRLGRAIISIDRFHKLRDFCFVYIYVLQTVASALNMKWQ